MKLKKNVDIKPLGVKLFLCEGEKRIEVIEYDRFLIKQLIKEIHDVKKLSELIMEHAHTNEMIASFILADFFLKYQEYIEDDDTYYEIIP